MAIAVVSSVSTYVTTGSSTGVDLPLSIPDPNTLLVVGYTQASSAILGGLSTVVWDSSGANTSLIPALGTAQGQLFARAWVLFNPSTGTHSVRISFLAQTADQAMCAVAYSGVDSTTPYSSATASINSTNSTGILSSAIPSSASDIVWSLGSIYALDTGSVTALSSATVRAARSVGAVFSMLATETPGSAAQTAGFSWTGATQAGLVSFNIRAAGGGGGGGGTPIFPSRRSLMGVGR